MTFNYNARSKTGEKVEGTVEADDRRSALRLVEKMGLVPVSLTESGAKGTAAGKQAGAAAHKKPGRMGAFDVLIFSTELSDLLAAGMTLGNALNLLANRKTGRPSDAIIPVLRDDIVQGASLSNALAKHPRSFSTLYVSMIRAGEASGALPEILKRLVIYYERVHEIRDKMITAFVYPAIVLLIGLATVIYIMLGVMPKFERIFSELGSSLPISTRILIGSSRWLGSYGWILVAGIIILVVLASRAVKTENGRMWWHGFLLKLPLMKGIITAGIYSNFARTLATLLSNGVPVLQALGIVEKTTGNAVIASEIRNAKDRVTDGTTISGPLAAGKVFPQMMTDMLSVGERTGNVPGALTHIAVRYEHQLDRSIKIFTTALEPILIFVMAILVGFVALSVLSAVFNLTSGLDAPGQ